MTVHAPHLDREFHPTGQTEIGRRRIQVPNRLVDLAEPPAQKIQQVCSVMLTPPLYRPRTRLMSPIMPFSIWPQFLAARFPPA